MEGAVKGQSQLTPCDLEGRKLREKHSITLFLSSDLPRLPCIRQIQLKAKGQGGLQLTQVASLGIE